MLRTTIGIDLGNTGAIAIYNGRKLTVHDMPVIHVVRTRRKVSWVDAQGLVKILESYGFQQQGLFVQALFEKTGAQPKQSNTSMFTFGRGAGIVEGVLAGLHIPYTLVQPQQWQKALGVVKGEGKARKDPARAKAMKLYPREAHLFSRKKDDGRADAALIARYGHTTTR